MTDTLHARYHCGKVQNAMRRRAAGILWCHSKCQKRHGNFYGFLPAAIADITLSGATTLVWRQSSAALHRDICGTLGARVPEEVKPARRLLLSDGLTDGAARNHIIENLSEKSQTDWYSLPHVVS